MTLLTSDCDLCPPCPVSGRGDPADRPPERHPGAAVGPDLRGAAGVEAAAADRLHRGSAQRLCGPAAELVRPLGVGQP